MKMSQFPLNLKHFEMLKMIMTCYRFAHKGRGTGRPSLHATGMKETRLAYNPPSLSLVPEPAPCCCTKTKFHQITSTIHLLY